MIDNLVSENKKNVEGIDFCLKRTLENGYIVKDISFKISEKEYHFQERVKAFTLSDFKDMFEQAGIQLLDVFGDYKLKKFHEHQSERLIMIFV